MTRALLLGAAALIALSAAPAMAGETATTTTTTTVKSVGVPGATVALPGSDASMSGEADMGIPADEDSATGDVSYESSGAVTTTTTTTDTVTTTTRDKPAVVPVTTTETHKTGTSVDVHGEKGSDESTDAGDKAAKSVVPLEDSSVPASMDTGAEGNAKVDAAVGAH